MKCSRIGFPSLLGIFAFLFVVMGASVAESKDLTIEEFLQDLSTVPDVVKRKDPFVEANAPFSVPKEEGVRSESAPVLERYPANSYVVLAVLLGDQYPRALVKLPSSEQGKVVIVREKDRLGNKNGIVTKISKEGLVVSQNVRSELGFVDKAEILLKVGGSPDQFKTVVEN